VPTPLTDVQLQHLADKSALHELVYTYCRAIDRRDFELVRELYHEDAIDDHGDMFCGPRDAYIAWLPGALAQFQTTQHRISNTLFAVDGDYAEGEVYAVAYHRTYPPDLQEVIGGGRYVDQYQRRNGIWKFSRRTVINDWMSMNKLDPKVFEHMIAGLPSAQPNETDPSYRQLRLLTRKTPA
jgi:ketosteroid isomerase-like protein